MLLAGLLGFALGFVLALAVRFRRKVRDDADDRVEDDPLVLERLFRYCQAI